MKLFLNLLVFFLSFTTLSVRDDFLSEFMGKVEDGYQVYEVLENPNNTNEYYSVKIVKGIYNNEPCYGVAFACENAGEYQLIIEKQDALYQLEKNDRGDGSCIAIKADSHIKIYVVDKDGREQSFSGDTILKRFDEKYFENNTNAITGKGNGKVFSKLSTYSVKIPYLYAFIYSACLIIVICLIVMIVIMVRKKGMFNKKVRAEGIVNIEELIEDAKQKEEVDLWEGYKPNKEEIVIEAVLDSEDTYIDLSEYLKSKGYKLDYSTLSEEEKNNLMIELMMLKNTKKISEDTYYEETYKLWKK